MREKLVWNLACMMAAASRALLAVLFLILDACALLYSTARKALTHTRHRRALRGVPVDPVNPWR